MDNVFVIKDFDGHLTIKVKTEANIKLASVANQFGYNTKEYVEEAKRLHQLVALAKTLDEHNTITDLTIVDSLETMITVIKTGIISPLTLTDDEFQLDDENEFGRVYENKRYYNVAIHEYNGVTQYINYKAFISIIKACYNATSKLQVKVPAHYIASPTKIYISKGGVVTGDYIKYCEIKKEVVNPDYSYLTIPIELPVSLITHNGDLDIYVVEHREPKLKLLMDTYNVVILNDEDIKGLYDIRKYTKLTK